MKTFLFHSLLLFCAASALAQTDVPVPCTISSRPSDAAIEVDGIPAGSTPATLSLAPGRHVAKLAPDGAYRYVAAGKDGGTSERVFAFEIIFTVLFLLGWTLAILGDVFNLTVPMWTEQILQSFKSDIEPSGLARRSIKKVEEASGKALKKAGPKIAAGVGASTVALGLAMLKRALRGK